MSALIPCIIAGGAGTRLWPVSRESMPKPFMRLSDGLSLLQKTFERVAELDDVTQVVTVINRELLFRTRDEYRPLNHGRLVLDFLLEPSGRNTAPAIAAAALHVARHYGEDAHLLVLPADHLIQNQAAFVTAITQARTLAEAGWLVAFGIRPTRAETGYGYLQQSDALEEGGFRVASFVEKPDAVTAQVYLESGKHLWNAGMFCFRVDILLRELREHAPLVVEEMERCLALSHSTAGKEGVQCELDSDSFAEVEDISIDYALMECSSRVAVVPCNLGWSDIGSWQTLRELTVADVNGNQILGDVVLHNVQGCYFDSPKRLIGAVGVRDLVVVDTPDALLIADTNSTQDVKFIAQELKKRGHQAYRLHRAVTRPWGTYTVLEDGPRFKIKRIMVRPGESLSLQMHHHRSEHWIVVCGMARVINGEHDFLLNTNESTFIPAGHSHRLVNPGVIDLVMIEVQSGEYLGEDDIVRFTDVYGRVPANGDASKCV